MNQHFYFLKALTKIDVTLPAYSFKFEFDNKKSSSINSVTFDDGVCVILFALNN